MITSAAAMNPDLELALRLADAADAITLRHFRSATLQVRTKIDMTPVSEADEAVERVIRELLERERPGDGIVGEEFGVTGSASRRWILDPIDGTKNYVRGIAIYGTLIALEEDGRVTAGVVSAPALGRRWWASRGDGAFCNGEPIRASRIATLDEAQIDVEVSMFAPLARRCGRARNYGDFWAHMLVAEGAIEIVVEPQVALWDMAAVQIIVDESGGRFTDLRGNPTPAGGSGLSTNGVLHDAVLESLR
jgi:histidinol-phosphatase